MNVQLQHSRRFLAATWDPNNHANDLVMNDYNVTMKFCTRTNDQSEINIAVGRVLYFIDHELTDTVFVCDQHIEIAKMLRFMNINVTTVPHEPVDQIIGMMLYAKFRAMMQGRVDIVALEISSLQGQDVIYLHEHDEPLGPLADPGWWHQPDINHCSVAGADDINSPALDIQPDGWKELDLQWPQNQSQSKIVYVNFQNKNANK
jgi:hypothetical protein